MIVLDHILIVFIFPKTSRFRLRKNDDTTFPGRDSGKPEGFPPPPIDSFRRPFLVVKVAILWN